MTTGFMYRYCNVISVILLTSAFVFLPLELSAQNYLDIQAELYGIPKKSKFHSSSRGSYNNPLALFNATKGVSQEVIGHIRSDKGVSFAGPAAVNKLLYDSSVAPTKSSITVEQKMQQMIEKNTTIKPIPACSRAKTEKTSSFFKAKNNDKNRVYFDTLYISHKDIPLDPQEALGINVNIVPYYEGEKRVSTLAIQGLNIPCLPYRLRSSGQFYFKHYGTDALKNYTSKPDAEGDLKQSVNSLFRERS